MGCAAFECSVYERNPDLGSAPGDARNRARSRGECAGRNRVAAGVGRIHHILPIWFEQAVGDYSFHGTGEHCTFHTDFHGNCLLVCTNMHGFRC